LAAILGRRGQKGTLLRSLLAVAKELFQVLRKELPTAGKSPRDKASRGDPVLNCANTDLKDLRYFAVGVHRFERQILVGQKTLEQWVLGCW
jgi:hypothetical protein